MRWSIRERDGERWLRATRTQLLSVKSEGEYQTSQQTLGPTEFLLPDPKLRPTDEWSSSWLDAMLIGPSIASLVGRSEVGQQVDVTAWMRAVLHATSFYTANGAIPAGTGTATLASLPAPDSSADAQFRVTFTAPRSAEPLPGEEHASLAGELVVDARGALPKRLELDGNFESVVVTVNGTIRTVAKVHTLSTWTYAPLP